MKKLVIQDICKNYGKKKALDHVTMELTPGVYGLLGPNGAGKSTLMNIIVGNCMPTSGSITYDGKDILGGKSFFRDIIGFMPQQQGLYSQFTGYRFLLYVAALKGMNKKETKSAVERCIDMVNMREHIDKHIGSYSGGMKQRLLIAQSILNNPDILVLDEPTAGLDPQERIRIRTMIANIAQEKIVILATHVVSDIEKIAREIILMKNGHLIAKDTPQKLKQGIPVYDRNIDLEDVYLHYFGEEGSAHENISE